MLASNNNIDPWLKWFCWAHLLAPKHVFCPHDLYFLYTANDDNPPNKPIHVWIPDKVYHCATTLEVKCSHVSSQLLYKEKK